MIWGERADHMRWPRVLRLLAISTTGPLRDAAVEVIVRASGHVLASRAAWVAIAATSPQVPARPWTSESEATPLRAPSPREVATHVGAYGDAMRGESKR